MTFAPHHPWLIAADRGGTFTDCCAIDPQGQRHRAKVLSNGRLRLTVIERGPTRLTLSTHRRPVCYRPRRWSGAPW
jgi:N-methylhydantoinase A/oxoprolinase/acetone carboxylase beta subunit